MLLQLSTPFRTGNYSFQVQSLSSMYGLPLRSQSPCVLTPQSLRTPKLSVRYHFTIWEIHVLGMHPCSYTLTVLFNFPRYPQTFAFGAYKNPGTKIQILLPTFLAQKYPHGLHFPTCSSSHSISSRHTSPFVGSPIGFSGASRSARRSCDHCSIVALVISSGSSSGSK